MTADRWPGATSPGWRPEAHVPSWRARACQQISRYGVPVAIVATFVVFSVLRPDSFFTELTIKGILRDCIPLMIVALGITAVLAMNDYDLSAGGLVSLCATTVIVLDVDRVRRAELGPGDFHTIGIGGLLGLTNGVLIAYVRLPSFILTIASGTVFAGPALQIIDSQSVYLGIPQGFMELASGTFLGFSNQVFIGIASSWPHMCSSVNTEQGRYMYAIGGNPEAARLAGVRVQRLRATGFALVGVDRRDLRNPHQLGRRRTNPNTGLGLLLPAYAAAFLGSSMFRVGVFTPLGTALGALYLQIIGTGLTILSLAGPIVQMIQGGILVARRARFATDARRRNIGDGRTPDLSGMVRSRCDRRFGERGGASG